MPARPKRQRHRPLTPEEAKDIIFAMDDEAPLLPATVVEAWQTVLRLRGYSDIEPKELGPGAWRVVATIPDHRRGAPLELIKEDVERTVFAMAYELVPPGVAVQVEGGRVYISAIMRRTKNDEGAST